MLVSNVTVHVVPVTEVHPLVHPPKECPVIGVGVSETDESAGKGAVQVLPQFIPAGELVMVPLAPPVTSTDRLKVALPCGQPKAAGPSTVIETRLLTMSLELLCIVA